MTSQSNNHCSACGIAISESTSQQVTSRCPHCGNSLEPGHQTAHRPMKGGPMSQRQLILMMVLLPLLVVAMTIGSWYLIKAYRSPSVQLESQSELMKSESMTAAKNSTLQPLNFIKK